MATAAISRAALCAGQVCGPALQARCARLPDRWSDASEGSLLAAAKLITTGSPADSRVPAKSMSRSGKCTP